MLAVAGLACMCAVNHAQTGPVKTVIVYKQPGRFAGWPANHGIWSWDNEIVVGFEAGYFRAAVREHAIDYTRPAEHLLARSRDGGKTWAIEKTESLKTPPGITIAGVPGEAGGRPVTENSEAIDFTRPGFAMTFRTADIHVATCRAALAAASAPGSSARREAPGSSRPGRG